MPKVRPADGIPVMPHIEEKLEESLRYVQSIEAEHGGELEKWQTDHPDLAPVVKLVEDFVQTICPPGSIDLSEAIEILKGLLLSFKLGLTVAESLEAHLATKQ